MSFIIYIGVSGVKFREFIDCVPARATKFYFDLDCLQCINIEMNTRLRLARWLALSLLLAFSFFVFHTIEHHHSHELQEKECPICHFGVDIALPAVLILALIAIPPTRYIVVTRFFSPSSLLVCAATPKRAPPAAI